MLNCSIDLTRNSSHGRPAGARQTPPALTPRLRVPRRSLLTVRDAGTPDALLATDGEGPLTIQEEVMATSDVAVTRRNEALWSMARMHNVLPSLLLVLVGAYSVQPTLGAFRHWAVWAMAAVSSGISVASVVVNDYFDFRSGVDVLNSPGKPLPSGAVPADMAILFSSVVYMCTLIAACLMDRFWNRIIIALSAAATLAYTPFLKRLPLVKNVVVAAIIAASPMAGALATGVPLSAVPSSFPPALFAFFGVVYREILMDVNDAAGDAASGVYTLPVCFGSPPAVLLAVASLLAGAAAAVQALERGSLAAAVAEKLPSLFSPLVVAGGAVGVLIAPLLSGTWAAWRSELDSEVLGGLIGMSFGPIACVMVLCAVGC